MIEETRNEPSGEAEDEESWPRREDTREFQAVLPPEAGPADAPAEPGAVEPDVSEGREQQAGPKLPPVQSVMGLEDDDGPEPGGRDFSWD